MMMNIKKIIQYILLWGVGMLIITLFDTIVYNNSSATYGLSDFVLDSITMAFFMAISVIFSRQYIKHFRPLQNYRWQMLLYSFLLLATNMLVAFAIMKLSTLWWGELPMAELLQNVYMLAFISTFVSSVEANISFQKLYHKQQEVNLQTSLMALKSQVDPHFLFNNFSILSDLIEENPKDARIFLDNLSRVYRYKLVNMTTDLVTLNDEMKMLRSYISLINSRFGDAIKVNMPDDIPSKKLPPLALQLLVENAIKHNAHSRQNPLIISIAISNDAISVSNAIMPLSSTESSTGLGLKNLQARYELLAGKEIEIYNNGQEFKTTIPLM